jgi:hypothetical protein
MYQNITFVVFILVYMLFKCKLSIPTLTAVKLVEYEELYLSLPAVLQEWGL